MKGELNPVRNLFLGECCNGHDFHQEDGYSSAVAGRQRVAGSGSICAEYIAEQLERKPDKRKPDKGSAAGPIPDSEPDERARIGSAIGDKSAAFHSVYAAGQAQP